MTNVVASVTPNAHCEDLPACKDHCCYCCCIADHHFLCFNTRCCCCFTLLPDLLPTSLWIK